MDRWYISSPCCSHKSNHHVCNENAIYRAPQPLWIRARQTPRTLMCKMLLPERTPNQHRLPPRPLPILHIRKQQLKAIAQCPHIRIHIPLKLKRLRDDFDWPALKLRVLARFEVEEEIARVFGVNAEGVDGAFGVGFRVGGEPAFWLYPKKPISFIAQSLRRK